MKRTTPLRTKIVAGPYSNDTVKFVATLSLAQLDEGPLWLALCRPEHAEPQVAARMLALLVLQQDFPLLHPIRTPTAPVPACAFFLPDGYWSDQRNIAIPDRVKGEVDRLADVLLRQHADYVSDFVAALAGRRPSLFPPVPKGLGLNNPDGKSRLVPVPPALEVDTAALGDWATEDLFQTLVAMDYRGERYLEHLTEDELDQRALDSLVNMYDLSGEHTLITNLSDVGVPEAIARLGEVMEEIRLRRGSIPDEWIRVLAPKWGLPTATDVTRRALDWITAHQVLSVDGLAKFTHVDHAREALLQGRLRLAPASGYDDESLNRAQRADELSLAHELDVKRVKVQLLSEDRSQNLADLSPLRLSVTTRMPTNAYVYCASMTISARLFHDFGANACLVVRDRQSFIQRLAKATISSLPGWQMISFNVLYVDPYEKAARHALPLFYKHIKYQYQREHRIIWLPPTRRDALEPVFLEIGSLEDIAEIIDLSSDDSSPGV